MTSTLSPVSLRTEDGLLVGTCDACDLALQQRESFDRDVAIGTFLSHHPESPLAVHRYGLPDGWADLPR